MTPTPKPALVACWKCDLPNRPLALPGVRTTKCRHCGAVHPGESAVLVSLFLNETKAVSNYL